MPCTPMPMPTLKGNPYRLLAGILLRTAIAVTILFSSEGRAENMWSAFSWAPAKLGEVTYEHGSMLVNVEIAGLAGSYLAQLDLGADHSILLGRALQQARLEKLDVSPKEETQQYKIKKIGDFPVEEQVMRIKPDLGNGASANIHLTRIASIGLEAFKNRLLVIDFKNQQYSILSDAVELRARGIENISYVETEMSHGKIFVSGVLDGELVTRIIVDTGASLFPLNVRREAWQKLSGIDRPEDADIRWTVMSWGKKLECYGATAHKRVVVAGISLDTHPIFFCDFDADTYASDWRKAPFKIDAVTGNALFMDKIVVFDFKSGKIGISTNASEHAHVADLKN